MNITGTLFGGDGPFEVPALLERHERKYRLAVIFTVVAAIAYVAVWAIEDISPVLSATVAVGFGGSFAIALAALRKRREELVSFALVLVPFVALGIAARQALRLELRDAVLGGLGAGATAIVVVRAIRAMHRKEEPIRERRLLFPMLLMPLFFVAGGGWTVQTARFLPHVFDTTVYAMDTTLGVHSFHVGRVLSQARGLEPVLLFLYDYQWVGVLVLYVRQLVDPRPRSDIFIATLLAVSFALIGYYSFPVVGPCFVLQKEFPFSPPEGAAMFLGPQAAVPELRNCMPSMHNAWGLLLIWQARPYGWKVRGTAYALEVATFLTTLGYGFHYLFDIVVAVPFVLAVHVSTLSVDERGARAKRIAIAGGAIVALGWLVAIRSAAPFFLRAPGVAPALAVLTVAASWWAYAKVVARSVEVPRVDTTKARERPPLASPEMRPALMVLRLATIAGITTAIYEIALVRSPLVVPAIVSGIALGFGLGARFARRDPLRIYGACMFAAAAFTAAAPSIVERFSSPAADVVFAAVPPILASISLPAMLLRLRERGMSTSASASWLVGVHAVGAALGVLLAGFFVVPVLGTHDTVLAAAAIGLAASLVALLVASRSADSMPPPLEEEHDPSPFPAAIATIIAVLASVVVLAFVVVADHLLAAIAGETPYAIAGARFAALAGLAVGALVSRRLRGASAAASALALGITACALALAILGAVHVVSATPAYLASFDGYQHMQTFGEHELVRLCVCLIVCGPPMLCAGALFTFAFASALDARGSRGPGSGFALVGGGCAAGAVGGALVTAWIVVPSLGSLRALHLVALVALAVVALSFAFAGAFGRRFLAAGIAVAALVLVAQPSSFDLARLANGAHVRFAAPKATGALAGAAERPGRGITVVVSEVGKSSLVTNGRVRGSDGAEGRTDLDLARAALASTATRHDRALVFGYGTGVLPRTLADGFAEVDVVEPNADLVRLAETHFGNVANGPVHVHPADGRAFLRNSAAAFDVVAVDEWTVPTRELYADIREHLASGGHVQHAARIHHIEARDVISMLATVHAVFPHVAFLGRDGRALLVGCSEPCTMRDSPSVLLQPDGVTALLADVQARGIPVDALVSTDDNHLLDYAMPRGEVLETNASIAGVLDELRPFSRGASRTPPSSPQP